MTAAAEHGGAAHSPHEGYALIKEEVEEAQAEMEMLNQRLDHLWTSVKRDEDQCGPPLPHSYQEDRYAGGL